MGKPTGFLEYERKNNQAVQPLERIKNFNEFHTPMREKDRREQAARCMELWRAVLPVRYDDRRNGFRLSSEQPGAGVERSFISRKLRTGTADAASDK